MRQLGIMLSAMVTGGFGLVLVYGLGVHSLGMDVKDLVLSILASNVGGFVGGLLTLAMERREPIRRLLLGNWIKTWAMLAILYTAVLLALSPALRDLRTLAILFVPLVCCSGFMLPLFGIVQDRIISWEQRRASRKPSQSAVG